MDKLGYLYLLLVCARKAEASKRGPKKSASKLLEEFLPKVKSEKQYKTDVLKQIGKDSFSSEQLSKLQTKLQHSQLSMGTIQCLKELDESTWILFPSRTSVQRYNAWVSNGATDLIGFKRSECGLYFTADFSLLAQLLIDCLPEERKMEIGSEQEDAPAAEHPLKLGLSIDAADGGKYKGFLECFFNIVDKDHLIKLQEKYKTEGDHAMAQSIEAVFLIGMGTLPDTLNSNFLMGDAIVEAQHYGGRHPKRWYSKKDDKYYSVSCVITLDKHAGWVCGLLGNAGGSVEYWDMYSSHRRSFRNSTSFFRCSHCQKSMKQCYHVWDIFHSQYEERLAAMLNEPFYRSLIVRLPKKNENTGDHARKEDWRDLARKLGLQDDEMTLATGKTKLTMDHYKTYCETWFSANHRRHDQVWADATTDGMILEMLKSMGVEFGSTDYDRMRREARGSPQWGHRQHGPGALDHPAGSMEEARDVLIYAKFLSNDLECELNLVNDARREFKIIHDRSALSPCGLHKVNRVNSTIIRLILNEVKRSGASRVEDKLREVQRALNNIFSNEDDWETDVNKYDMKLKVEADLVSEIKMDYARSSKVIAHVDRILNEIRDKILRDAQPSAERQASVDDRLSRISNVVRLWAEARAVIEQKTWLTDPEVHRYQDLCDDLRVMWIEVWGEETITNYLGDCFYGVDRILLLQHRSLYYYSNCGNEAYVGVVRAHTEKAACVGNRGKGGKGGIVESVMNISSIRACRLLDVLGGSSLERQFAEAGRRNYNATQKRKRHERNVAKFGQAVRKRGRKNLSS